MEKEGMERRILKALADSGMTQKELAEKAEITEAAVSHYIKGDRVPRTAVAERIAEALNVSVDYLISGMTENMEKDLAWATTIIARNANVMSANDKKKIIEILVGVR